MKILYLQSFPSVMSELWLWSLNLMRFSAIQIQEHRTGMQIFYWQQKAQGEYQQNFKKNYINFLEKQIIFPHIYSSDYFMIMVLQRGPLKGRGLCLGWAGNIAINWFANSLMITPKLEKLSCMSWIPPLSCILSPKYFCWCFKLLIQQSISP